MIYGSLDFIPEISDQVTVDIKHNLVVEIIEIPDDEMLYKGIVIHGLFTGNCDKDINVGELVEFSKKKIAVIVRN